MTTAREQAREAVRPLTDNMGVNRLKRECADAASDVWEPLLRDLVASAEHVIDTESLYRAREALG